jgi:hypothetical protein
MTTLTHSARVDYRTSGKRRKKRRKKGLLSAEPCANSNALAFHSILPATLQGKVILGRNQGPQRLCNFFKEVEL